MSILVQLAATRLEPGSGIWKHIDTATLQRIADLFPAPTLGQVFVERFVERALAERSSVPDIKEGDMVICAKSIANLGKDLDLSHDTTQKYVVLFKALGLLQKQAFMGQIAFILSLGIYQPPPTLAANLEHLIERCKAKKSRIKFHDLLISVKQRCLVTQLGAFHFFAQLYNCELERDSLVMKF